MIGRDQAKINTLIIPLKSKPSGCAVQMAVVALLHAVLLQPVSYTHLTLPTIA